MKSLLKLTSILAMIIAFNLTTFGQHQFGVKVSGGLSRITTTMKMSNVVSTTPFVLSGQGGLYYNLFVGKKSILGAELLFSQVEGKEIWEVDFIDIEGTNSGTSRALTYRHISNLSLPVYYGFKMNKLILNAGFQVSYAITSSGREKNDATVNEGNEEQYHYSRKVDNINIDNIDYGPKAGIVYHLTKKLAVEATYYYGMNDIQKAEALPWELKVQQLTFGIRYALCSKESTK